MNQLTENALQWIIGLITSHSVWGTIIGAVIGGLITLRITNKQVRKNEELSIQNNKNERRMELTRIAIDECRKSLDFLRRLPDDLINIQKWLKNDMELADKAGNQLNESLEYKQKLNQAFIQLSSELIYLESAMKISGFLEKDILKCREFRKLIYNTLDYIPEQKLHEYTQSILQFPPIIDSFHRKFIEKQEKLVEELRKDLS